MFMKKHIIASINPLPVPKRDYFKMDPSEKICDSFFFSTNYLFKSDVMMIYFFRVYDYFSVTIPAGLRHLKMIPTKII